MTMTASDKERWASRLREMSALILNGKTLSLGEGQELRRIADRLQIEADWGFNNEMWAGWRAIPKDQWES